MGEPREWVQATTNSIPFADLAIDCDYEGKEGLKNYYGAVSGTSRRGVSFSQKFSGPPEKTK